MASSISTSCGHNFCMGCIKEYWDNCSQIQCPVCKEIYLQRPELRVNTFISELAAQFRKLAPEKFSSVTELHSETTQMKMQQMIQDRLRKIQEVKVQVAVRKEISASVEVFNALMRSIERSQAELLEVMEEEQRAAERQAEGLIKDLQQEITELQRRNSELEKISHTEDHLHLLQVSISISATSQDNTPHAEGSISKLETLFRKQMEKITALLDVTLDPDSAHRELILSADGKQVRHGDKRQKLPKNPERFDYWVSVLGKEGFSSGRFYYEVEVGGKTDWDLGVARESINRKGEFTLSPEDGYWTVYMSNGNEYEAGVDPPVLLSLNKEPQKVGVFVDYEEGLVSFYGVENSSHIYSFTGQTFYEKLYPYFSPGLNYGGENSAPLIISPAEHHVLQE
uniref:Uncharacterized protein n=1 Tax=Denticeps clupeoides TaxID=299321 RepID=A0AAY3ZYT1_9TELE